MPASIEFRIIIETFRALNRLGRFLVIYDGFDEMKHGMTFGRFQHVFGELMRLDEGDARVLILGRDTALHDDLEFRAIIGGRQMTGAGRDVPDPSRRPGRHLEIRGFTVTEAHQYVRSFLPVRAQDVFTGRGETLSNDWLEGRINTLLSGSYDELLARPVHAQMLCEIAAYPESSMQHVTVFDLFDTFVHYLLEREVRKKGRDPRFNIDVRRQLNGALAWWLWERGGASTTTLSDIPLELCKAAVVDVSHSLDDASLKRELIQGCLIEKAADTIYFGHRSLQEFLVAEHLIDTNLLSQDQRNRGSLQRVLSNLTPEVIAFIVGGVQASAERLERAIQWFNLFGGLKGTDVSLQGFGLFIQLASELLLNIEEPTQSPWLLWLDFFRRSGVTDFSQRIRNTYNVLADSLQAVKGKAESTQAAAIYVLARVLRMGPRINHEVGGVALAAMIDVTSLKNAVRKVRGHRSTRFPVRRDESFLLWAFLRNVQVIRDGDLSIKVNPNGLLQDARLALSSGFADDRDVFETELHIPVQALYRALARLEVSDHDIDAIRPFFTEGAVRNSITPLEVTFIKR